MSKISIIKVSYHGKLVGSLALTPEHLCAFEYDSNWIKTGFSISPLYLPLKSGVQIAKREPFSGGFGVFDDSLPDGWGNLILDRFLIQQGIDPYKLSLLERLSLTGVSGRGALEYHPDRSTNFNEEFTDFDKIAQEAERILENKGESHFIDDLYRFSGSSGGARPKIFTTINQRHWLVKFKNTIDPQNIGLIEHQYALLAQECGINMPEVKLFNEKYFAVERFDRSSEGKIHTASAAGLLHANYRIPSLDYELLLKLTRSLTHNHKEVIQMYRRMIFNILIENKDDHAKNFSFQYKDGEWKLSPAYDILPSHGFNGFHTTTINGQGEASLTDVLHLAKEVSINNNEAMHIIEELSKKISGKNLAMKRLL